MKLNQLLSFSLIVLFFSSCTFVRTVRYFKPSTLDHEKMFACDTVQAKPQKNYATTSPNQLLEKSLFTDAITPTSIPPIQQWIPTAYQLEATNLEDYLDKSQTTALLVIKNDSLLYEKYNQGGAKDKARIVFSVSKAVTAILTAIAHEEGLIDIHQKVADFIPEFGKDKRKKITINHLLNMTSGLDWMDHDNIVKLGFLYYNKNQAKFIIRNAKAVHKPGTHHAYKSLSTQILGICLERALNKPIAQYLQEKIWQPLGMKHDAYVTLDSEKKHNTRAFGGMAMTAQDMARLGKLLLNNGQWQGKQIIPTWFMDDLAGKRSVKDNWCNDRLCFKRNGYHWGDYENNTTYWASGYLGQYIFVDPIHKVIIVRQGNDEPASWRMFMGRLSTLLGTGENDLTNTEKFDFSTQFEGTYQTTDGTTMQLTPGAADDYGRKTWLWQRDTKLFSYHHKAETVYQEDGVSVQHKTRGHYSRLFFDVKDNQVVGFYYTYTPTTQTQYFKKVVPAQ